MPPPGGHCAVKKPVGDTDQHDMSELDPQPTTGKPKLRWNQFSIWALLLAMLFIAGFFAGYRTGFQLGRTAGQAQREKDVPYAVAYPVSDLLLGVPDFPGSSEDYDSLMENVQMCVAPQTWECNGGTGTCLPSVSDKSLRIAQTQEVHTMIRDFLQALCKRQIEWIKGQRPPNVTPIPRFDVVPPPTPPAR